MVIVRNL